MPAFAPRVAIAAVAASSALAVMAPVPARADPPSPLTGLVDAAAQRLQTADPVAASKWITGGPIEDAAREQGVIDAVRAAAAAKGVDQRTVEEAFRDQIAATVAVEYALFSYWKLTPDAAPATAPDLSDSRATIDGLNQTIVGEIAAQRDSLQSAACAGDLAAAIAAVVAARGLDDLYRRGLDFATRSYCR